MRCISFRTVPVFRLVLSLACLALVGAAGHAQSTLPLPDLHKSSVPEEKPEVLPDSGMKIPTPDFDPEKELTKDNTSNYRYPSRLNIGVFLPSSGVVRTQTHSTYYAFGGSVDLPPSGPTSPCTPLVYLDGAYHHDNAVDSEATLVGGGLGFRLYPRAKRGFDANHGHHAYFGAGVGFYYLETDFQGEQHQTTSAGGRLVVGTDLPDNWSIELNYTEVGKVNGESLSGGAAVLAYRM